MTRSSSRPDTPTILIASNSEGAADDTSSMLRRAGFEMARATADAAGAETAAIHDPDLILLHMDAEPGVGSVFLERFRAREETRRTPVILLSDRGEPGEVVSAMGMGADDYLAPPYAPEELVARIRAKLERVPVPSEALSANRRTGLLTTPAMRRPIEREWRRATEHGRPVSLAELRLDEFDGIRDRFGDRVAWTLLRRVGELVADRLPVAGVVGHARPDSIGILIPDLGPRETHAFLSDLSQRIAGHAFRIRNEVLRVTPAVGFAYLDPETPPERWIDQASAAADHAASHLDLRVIRYDPKRFRTRERRKERGPVASWFDRNRLVLQMVGSAVLSLVLPYALYWGLDELGLDITPFVYVVVVISLLVTAAFIWIEGFLSLGGHDPPEEPSRPHPPASAIIAAYLPNEAATVASTLEAFQRSDYPGDLQIILAYNTPRPLPVEAVLREMAERDPRIVPLKVEGSTSKAQNVNAALAHVTGEFVGVFDADHQPDPDAYGRAWRWLSNGYDVVQGHCLIRNGDESWVARTVAVEFEAIYGVSHPGRARLHGFGIFGGSNGYWNTELLRRIRMQGSMLTEDIDSSLRAVESGYRIASDPGLVSRELAPVTLQALTNQRLRWAQGWFQVTLRHLVRGLRADALTWRQKAGFLHLLGWREAYPWLSMQMFPILAYWIVKYGGAGELDWLVPVLVLTTLFTLSVGPGQTVFAYLNADPEIRERRGWFWAYFFVASFFYTPYKNLLGMVAQIKEAMRERAWKVTPRSADR